MKIVSWLVLIFVLLFIGVNEIMGQSPDIIPLPNAYQSVGQSFLFEDGIPVVSTDKSFASSAKYLREGILRHTGLVAADTKSDRPAITLVAADAKSKLGIDAYQIRMNKEGIIITAAAPRGMFYGVNSLLQMIAKSEKNQRTILVSCWNIDDEPLYQWRGFMLDESRHFFGKEEVRKILDQMAWLKLNKFHWHLTDEPGWRMQIKRYPLLTLVGGIGTFTDSLKPAAYYTQSEIKEIVAYAAERFIEVIPEIDMPGHARAANRAYPEFSGGGSEEHPDFTFNPGKEETYQYLTNILDEAAVLFPSKMIHLGGDEVSFGIKGWNQLQGVKDLMKEQNFSTLEDVERYFFKRMTDSALKKFDKVLGWDEMADGNLPRDSAIIFWWRHDKPEQLGKAFDKSYNVVLCPRIPFYFDFVEDSLAVQGRRWQGSFAPIKSVYEFQSSNYPEVKGNEKKILGIQANLWTETVQTSRRLEYLTFPRIAALAEAAWTKDKNRDYPLFLNRLKDEIKLYKHEGIYHYNPIRPEMTPEVVDFY